MESSEAMQLPPEGSDYDNSVELRRRELLGLWGRGILPATGYVYLALALDGYFLRDNGEDRSFDIGAFCSRWAADESFTISGKKPKPLKAKQVLAALATFEEKEIAEMPQLGRCLKMQGV
jgi:hypothetical protein